MNQSGGTDGGQTPPLAGMAAQGIAGSQRTSREHMMPPGETGARAPPRAA